MLADPRPALPRRLHRILIRVQFPAEHLCQGHRPLRQGRFHDCPDNADGAQASGPIGFRAATGAHRLGEGQDVDDRELGARPEVQYVFIFENKGREIGVTLSHPHGQIYAYPFIPPKLERELYAMRRHHESTGGNLLLEITQYELEDGRRIVQRMDGWVAFVPFFARYPYEVYLVPEQPRRDLLDLTDAEITGLARILKDALRRYDALWGFSLPYIMAQHPRPTDGGEHPYWQFHIEFYPPYRTRDKLKYLAGSESGAGVFINDTLPEETAKTLREVEV